MIHVKKLLLGMLCSVAVVAVVASVIWVIKYHPIVPAAFFGLLLSYALGDSVLKGSL